MRVLIYIVCYNAEQHIGSVLERIPAGYRSNPDIKVLISDDCSADNTARVAWDSCARLGYTNFEVFKTRVNQGYGGNQKIGYNYACSHDFDYAVLLHGDGQYAPEALPKFFDIFPSGADVILGSRMLNKKDALKGGMPLYKFTANVALTLAQNYLSGLRLAEFHTGYRAYATRFLRQVPFELNSSDFDFDTDILLQAQLLGKDIREFPIDTFYGEETCHVNGVRYAMDILKTSFRFRLQQLGIGSSLKFRGSKQIVYRDKFWHKHSSHNYLLRLIEGVQPRRIFEIGSGAGHLGTALRNRGIDLVGIDICESQHDGYAGLYCGDVETFDFSNIQGGPFDMVCLMEVLEHLKEPEKLLLRLRNSPLFENALFVISVPNVAFFSLRIGLLFGRFNYSDRGILDIDHKRLFTYSSFDSLLRESGYRVQRTISVPPPFYLLKSGPAAMFLTAVFNMLSKALPGLFSFQVIKVAAPVPTSIFVMENLLSKIETPPPGQAGSEHLLK